jgi:phosphoribosylaminoimidazolecarboxamide formyltransferase / IMP cyclohydrolase
MDTPIPVRSALISVFDKQGLAPLVAALVKAGTKIYSTGGTAAHLKELGADVTTIESVTQFPEMMDGRVKTLHPRVFGGILARRDFPEDLEQARRHEIPLIDLVVVNLYPFWDHLKDDIKTQTKFVDIGGPSMLRAAAKNFHAVTVASDPSDYAELAEQLESSGGYTTLSLRKKFSARTFQRTSQYDALIASTWLEGIPLGVSLAPQTALRYGENPHQKAAWAGQAPGWKILQGKELSYNNLLDTEAAARIVAEFEAPAISIIKHNSPCGVAAGNEPQWDLWKRAFEADSKSAFGGIVAFNRPVSGPTAEAMSNVFLEVVIAPSISPDAASQFAKKKNLRVIEWASPQFQPYEVRTALGGWLVQQSDDEGWPAEVKTVTQTQVPPDAWDDIRFAWLVCKHVRSNAIVIAKQGATLGIGGGQVSRVDAVNIALSKCTGGAAKNAVLASDAFFPFRDNIDLLRGSGIRAIVQPGGSVRDEEVIHACNEQGIAMVFTGTRHFRH